MIKKRGEYLVKAIHYIIQKSWSTIPDSFKLDPKVMLPNPGKDNYTSVRSFRPITLESVLGKVFETVTVVVDEANL